MKSNEEDRVASGHNANAIANIFYEVCQPILTAYPVQDVILGLCCTLAIIAKQHNAVPQSIRETLNKCLKAPLQIVRQGGAKA